MALEAMLLHSVASVSSRVDVLYRMLLGGLRWLQSTPYILIDDCTLVDSIGTRKCKKWSLMLILARPALESPGACGEVSTMQSTPELPYPFTRTNKELWTSTESSPWDPSHASVVKARAWCYSGPRAIYVDGTLDVFKALVNGRLKWHLPGVCCLGKVPPIVYDTSRALPLRKMER